MLQPAPWTGFSSERREAHPPEWFHELARSLPPAGEWQVMVGRMTTIDPGKWRVHGNGVPYQTQLISPRLDVPAGRTVRFRLEVMREQARVCIGVLDNAANMWILAPEILTQEYEFKSGSAVDVRIVVNNCDARLTENADSIFVISGGSYEPVAIDGAGQ
jgi:hypothetical protein